MVSDPSKHEVAGVDLTAFGPDVENARAMWAADPASAALGMRALEVTVSEGAKATTLGHARVQMVVEPHMVNGHDICHGGYIFTLADSAFALACNAAGQSAVAAHCDIDFLESVALGDTLIAEASERVVRGRSGLADVTVTRASDGHTVAEFRGRSRAIPTART